MKRIASLCFVVLWACISTAQTPKKPVFTSFDYPGAVDTEGTAITPSGEIVGRYFTFDGTNFHEHGFLLTNGQFQPIDFPGAIFTDVTYINPRGQIVGAYALADGKSHGYILRDGTFTSIDFPGAAGTFAGGIGPNGEVVGAWFDQAGQNHGFVLDKQGKFTQVDVPGYQTLVTQISSGRMIGDYTKDFTIVHGFVVKNGNFQSIDFPAFGVFPACQTSFVSGLNPEGDIVGGCIRNFLDENGWLVKDGEYVPINYPNSLSTYANGINPQGQIVGRYSINDGLFDHGFLLTWQP
jgi:hypothetical protein